MATSTSCARHPPRPELFVENLDHVDLKGDERVGAMIVRRALEAPMCQIAAKKVVRVALQNAASVASLLLTTDALVSEMPEKEKAAAGGHSHAH